MRVYNIVVNSNIHELFDLTLCHYYTYAFPIPRYLYTVVCFAGDALICLFRATDDITLDQNYALRALQCACELRKHHNEHLATHIAVTVGEVRESRADCIGLIAFKGALGELYCDTYCCIVRATSPSLTSPLSLSFVLHLLTHLLINLHPPSLLPLPLPHSVAHTHPPIFTSSYPPSIPLPSYASQSSEALTTSGATSSTVPASRSCLGA